MHLLSRSSAGLDGGVADRLVRIIEEEGASLSSEELTPLLTGIAALLAALAGRILTSGPPNRPQTPAADENLSINEAARRLGVSKDYLYRHAKRLPFTRRIGRRVLFSARALEEWNRKNRGSAYSGIMGAR